jgi:hypothetical protein
LACGSSQGARVIARPQRVLIGSAIDHLSDAVADVEEIQFFR